MKEQIRPARELQNPGFVLFEGIDFTGKSTLAKGLVNYLNSDLKLNTAYSYNSGFLNSIPVDERLLSQMNSKEKSNFFFPFYLSESLSSDPGEFKEIFQDRYSPSLGLYALMRAHMSFDEISPFIKGSLKPKYVFLVECDYDERVKRSRERKNLTNLEVLSISSEKTHNYFINTYRRLIDVLGVPTKIINTTKQSCFESIQKCVADINEKNILTYPLQIDSLVVDFESRVYESTANDMLKEINTGQKLLPILVTRKIDSSGNYINTIKDGRHRAYAAWKANVKSIPAYINYEVVDSLDELKFKALNEFTFK